MRTLVGTCGFAEAQSRIFRDFGILEVQQTFYQPPMRSTAERWRERAPKTFVFTLKAWQLFTHEASSPTYRRLKSPLTASERNQVGNFKWNTVTRMAWDRTQEISDALDAEAIVFQTPRSFQPTTENLRRIRTFFEHINRRGRRMIFEPRGNAWRDEIIRPLLEDLSLVHGLDPFLRRPAGRGLRYFRLHGKPAYHYRYRYSDADLNALRELLSNAWPNRVLFNNDSMADDARRFLNLISAS
jgi:uncharacterized protein YecE (DUF72 family)